MIKKKNKGFTLIELLVVIAIIGILASVVLVSLNSARAKARDARRQSDIRQIALAMEMKYDDDGAYLSLEVGVDSKLTTIAIGTYLPTIPKDPVATNGAYYAFANTGGNEYCVWAALESGGGFTAASEKGVTELATADVPTSLTCW